MAHDLVAQPRILHRRVRGGDGEACDLAHRAQLLARALGRLDVVHHAADARLDAVGTPFVDRADPVSTGAQRLADHIERATDWAFEPQPRDDDPSLAHPLDNGTPEAVEPGASGARVSDATAHATVASAEAPRGREFARGLLGWAPACLFAVRACASSMSVGRLG